ncbi:MAG: hypothetical protein WA817_07635 [Candidatus Acidiferrum sp.]
MLMKPRFSVLALLLTPLLVGATTGPPLFHISVYAPAQEGSPLRTLSLQYDEGGFIRATLLNVSDKSIAKVAMASAEVAPLGCGAQPKTRLYVGGSVQELPIPPHGTIVTPPRGNAPNFPATAFITNAKRLEAASIHVQIVILEVDFADGTSWRSEERLPHTPFDSSLADADAGKCEDSEVVTKALSVVDGFEFSPRIDKATTAGKEGTSSPPHLFFSCSIVGTKAVCPTP